MIWKLMVCVYILSSIRFQTAQRRKAEVLLNMMEYSILLLEMV